MKDARPENAYPSPQTASSSRGYEEEFPRLQTASSSKKFSKGDVTDTEKPKFLSSHFNRAVFKEHRMAIKSFANKCKFSGKPKYDVQLVQPNDFELDWVYSVPCGDCGPAEEGSWIFLDQKPMPLWGPDQKEYITGYLEDLNWSIVTSPANKHFLCPNCAPPSVMEM